MFTFVPLSSYTPTQLACLPVELQFWDQIPRQEMEVIHDHSLSSTTYVLQIEHLRTNISVSYYRSNIFIRAVV